VKSNYKSVKSGFSTTFMDVQGLSLLWDV